jgi:serine/threonine-protein kinase
MISAFSQRWHEIEPLIDRLFDVPVAERTQWLHQHCADATLRVLVVQALDNASGIEALERGMAQWLPALIDETAEALPTIAGYRVLRFVGAGGMASVFEAERELPGGPQRVALKLLRIDVHDADERRRFLREQRILARLQHPHIAQLLDAGFSPTGTPFLALEYVAGDNLVAHAERLRLSRRDRLALFIDVCAAVEHAHRALIVHRDLKPSNVLVGADGGVKLVDFGIAKLLTGEGERTRTEARRLTRSYAAPEQFAGDVATTAIDVYALGILLAELLAGKAPRRDGEHGVDEEAWRRTLGVDLHAIVQQATRAEPARRYASVAALSDDIQRYMDGKPLQARADTLSYRVVMFTRRHALAVSLGAVIVVLLASATAVGVYEARQASRAALAARAQAVAAESEAQRAGALKSFLEGLFDSSSHGTEANETAQELLARGRERADRDFAMQPALRAEIIALVGDLERRSGHPERAWMPLQEAAALANMQFGPTDPRTLHVEYLLAKEADELGRVRDATARLQHAIDAFEQGSHRDSTEEVLALAWLAGLDERIGESTKAIDVGGKALALARRVLSVDSDALTEAVMNLGWIQMDAGHADSAAPLLREALARKRSHLGAGHAEVADAMAILTSNLLKQGRYAEAEQVMRDALEIDAHAYTHPNAHTAWHLNDLANVFAYEGKFDEAGVFYAKSLAIDQALAPAGALNQAISIGNLARLHFAQGALAEADAGLRESINRKQAQLGADYADNGRSYDRACLAEVLISRKRLDEAQLTIDAALAEARQRHRGAHPDIAFALAVEAELMAARGAKERAVTVAEEAAAMYASLDDRHSEKAIRASLLLGDTLQALGRYHDAATQLGKALNAAEAITPRATALMALIDADLARVDDSLNQQAAGHQRRAEATTLLAELEAGPNSDRDAATRLLAGIKAKPRHQ